MNEHDQEETGTSEVSIGIRACDGNEIILPNVLVSIGMPIRNGGKSLRYALESIVCQDYQNLEIIISDNDSSDDTALIVLEYQRRDSRIIYHQQPKFLTALENFRFVLDEARGDYFMWAAHDDTRSRDYVSGLLNAMQNDAEPILIFGDLCTTCSIETKGLDEIYDFDTTNLPYIKRIRKTAQMSCNHIYGLWRTDVLRTIQFHPCTWWPDLPIMTSAAYLGKFMYVKGPKFTYLSSPKSDLERAIYQDGKYTSNKYGNLRDLIFATYKSTASVGGILIGLIAALFVAENHARNLPGFILRKLHRAIFTRLQSKKS